MTFEDKVWGYIKKNKIPVSKLINYYIWVHTAFEVTSLYPYMAAIGRKLKLRIK